MSTPPEHPALEDVVVIFDHPFGEIEVPFHLWASEGPGERPLLQLKAARRQSTGEPLPMRVVPLRYRNNKTTRLLQKLRILDNPWH